MPLVTALRATRRGRVAVYADGEFLCSVSEAAVARWRLHKGRELRDEDVESLIADASVELALSDAHRLLGHRARSVQELRRRLLAAEHAPPAVESALARLEDDGLLDDAGFARSYVADKRRLAGWGEERIRRGLAEAGVAQEHTEAALAAAAEGEPEGAEVARALAVLRRRTPGVSSLDDAARRRAYQLLLRRGFGSGVAYAAIRSWSAGAPADDAGADAGSWDDQSG